MLARPGGDGPRGTEREAKCRSCPSARLSTSRALIASRILLAMMPYYQELFLLLNQTTPDLFEPSPSKVRIADGFHGFYLLVKPSLERERLSA
ncbi:hypothetical protein N9L68_00625 [bacterium]|nr:hypothetical protein [bacterium]